MQNFVHLHVHTYYSILDGQASIKNLVNKAINDGMPGIAVTDHGNMFGIKEFWNYVSKVNSDRRKRVKSLKKLQERMLSLLEQNPDIAAYKATLVQQLDTIKAQTKNRAELSDEEESKIDKLLENIATIEEMEKEFSLDANRADTTIAELEATPDFKPIIGCEVYVARNGLQQKRDKEDAGGYHLILLAKNLKGYKNLIKIVSKAWTEGFYHTARTDHAELERYHEGLICCSACLGGEVPKYIEAGDIEGAERIALWHKQLFGDDYYLELQLHKATIERANHSTYPMQLNANRHIVDIARKHNIKLICSNDVHFVDEDDAEAHDRLICLNTGRELDDPKRMLYSKQEWLKTRSEMAEVFAEYPEAMANTLEVCDKVEHYSIDHAPIMPMFDIPSGFGTEEEYRQRFTHEDLLKEFTSDENGNSIMDAEAAEKKISNMGGYDALYRIKLEADYLAKLTMDGAAKRYGSPLDEEIAERLKFELHIMKTMGFPGYFLIVQDFIRAAREELNVWVGPGRGSAAGSAVAYCLGITQINPIKYDLLFERFLNPDRISLPDIDIDFDDEGRGRVLEWVTQKYGKEKVAHIITYGTMATKMALKDVARVQRLPLAESDRLCKLIPTRIPDPKDRDKQLKINLKNCIEFVPELKAAEQSNDPVMRDTIKYARKLEGNVRGRGVHACGTIICRDDITDWVPVSTALDKETNTNILVTQYEGSVIEDTGLIKMDFLGLKNLTIMKDAVENIRRIKGVDVDIENIPIDDKKTYKLYCEGRTIGTFQFESPGMQKYLRELQPSVFEDLIAMNALYRPGPMDYIPDFIDRKHGRKPIEYDIPIMEKYLKDTYGITVYQEQVMLLSRLLADFTRGEADTLRKAMGKKIKSKLDELRPKFIKGGTKNGHNKTVLRKIWKDWERFASYAFNKSHATCYSWVAYQTAYLKANFPSEYMAALLSSNLNDISTLTNYMNECKNMGINVLSPDVSESMLMFSSNKQGDIRFGLAAIKGVGEAAAQSIIDEREKNGPYKDIYDLFERMDYTRINRKCIENIAYAGGLDSLCDFPRYKLFGCNQGSNATEPFIEQLMRYGQRYKNEKDNAQQSLFGGDSGVDTLQRPMVPNCPEWNRLEGLRYEREVVGIYLSHHPLDEYKPIIQKVCNSTINDLEHLEEHIGKELVFAGIVDTVEHKSFDNRTWGVIYLEDYTGRHEIRLSGKTYEQFRIFMFEGYYLMVRGLVVNRTFKDKNGNDTSKTSLQINSMTQLSDIRDGIKAVNLSIPISDLSESFINELDTAVKKSKGKAQLRITIYDNEGISVKMHTKKRRVSLGEEICRFIDKNEIEYSIDV